VAIAVDRASKVPDLSGQESGKESRRRR